MRRVAEPHLLHPARVGLLVDQPRRIRRPDISAEAPQLLLRDELRLCVRDQLLRTRGELPHAAAGQIRHPQLVGADEGELLAVGREARIEERVPLRVGPGHFARRAAGDGQDVGVPRQRHHHQLSVARRLEGSEPAHRHAHPLAPRFLLRRERLLRTFQYLLGRHQLPHRAAGHLEGVEAHLRTARRRAQEQHRRSIRGQLDGVGPAERVGARLGIVLEELEIGIAEHGEKRQ